GFGGLRSSPSFPTRRSSDLEGYEVESVPEDILMVLPSKGGTFQITSKIVGTDLTINCSLKLDQIHFQPEEYPSLKKFIDLVMEKDRKSTRLNSSHVKISYAV